MRKRAYEIDTSFAQSDLFPRRELGVLVVESIGEGYSSSVIDSYEESRNGLT